MRTWTILKRRYKRIVGFLLILGLINSIWSASLLILINNKLTNVKITSFDPVVFISLMLISFFAQRFFHRTMIRLINTTTFRINMELLNRIRSAEFEKFSKMQKGDIYAVLGDLQLIGSAPPIFMEAFNCSIMILIALIYLAIVSLPSALIILATMLILLALYLRRNREVIGELNKLRNYRDEFYAYINDLLFGFKEIKMSDERNHNLYFKFMRTISRKIKDADIATSGKYLTNELTGKYSWFAVIWIILFILPDFVDVSTTQISAFVVTILFIISPVQSLVGFIPNYARMKIALERVKGIEAKLGNLDSPARGQSQNAIFKSFQRIDLNDTVYSYTDSHTSSPDFVIGPVSLQIKKGETIFMVGGNGSGKSTLLYLLAGLYQPCSGSISFNNQTVNACDYSQYRNLFSFVFSDHYMFAKNYNNYQINTRNKEYIGYLELVRLQHKIVVEDDNDGISENLSKGQMKRLALVHALLEDKEILIFDELAAEQDPEFREYFYSTIIPILKQRGKTIIAATHDERYFHHADRIIKMECGHVISDKSQRTYVKN